MEEDWRPSVSASDSKTTLESVGSAPSAAHSEAFNLENRAYQDSKTRAQYDEVCRVVGIAAPVLVERDSSEPTAPQKPGESIGSYRDCFPVASGVTSTVFRCKDRALKVITETYNLEPHNPDREVKILAELKRPCIPLLESFRDREQRLTLVFPYMPLTLADVIAKGPLPVPRVRRIFKDLFTALKDIHARGIIHRDVKPTAILLESLDGPAYLSDFGTAWHPSLSASSEPPKDKILDIGTGPYRAPECLFGDKSYGPAVDSWASGAMLAECCRESHQPLFESRPAHEDGNQLGLILSIFKTLGTPTKETWPEAEHFKTPPFVMYEPIQGHDWEDILPDARPDFRHLVTRLVRFDSKRATAQEALNHECMADEGD